MTLTPEDRAIGAMIGSAYGDALGVPYELGIAPKEFPPRMKGGGLGPYKPGEWSDDTQMMILAARAALSQNPGDTLAEGLTNWLADGATDVGNQTRSVIRDATSTTYAGFRAAALRHTLSAAGNGAVTRVLPIAIRYLQHPEDARDLATALTLMTHPDPGAVAAATLWTETLRRALNGQEWDPQEWLSVSHENGTLWKHLLHPDTTLGPNDGSAITAIAVALQSVRATTTLIDAVNLAIEGSWDTDSVAALAGALAGAIYGPDAIPTKESLRGWPNMDAGDLEELAISLCP